MRPQLKQTWRSVLGTACLLSLALPAGADELGSIRVAPAPRLQLDAKTVPMPMAPAGNYSAVSSAYAFVQDTRGVPEPPAATQPSPLDLSGDERQADTSNRDAAEDRNNESGNASSANGRSENSLTPLQNRTLSIPVQVVDLSMDALGTGALPDSAAAERAPASLGYPRPAMVKSVHWQPTLICHFPLRFEDAMLERHGHVRFGHLQPLAAGLKFFGTIPLLPYLHTLQPTCEPVYALGNYRAGSCAPLLRDSLPYDRHAAVVEALSLAGFFWAMPL